MDAVNVELFFSQHVEYFTLRLFLYLPLSLYTTSPPPLPPPLQDVCVLGFKLLVQDVSGISPDQLRLVIDGKQMEDGPGNQPNSITSYPAISNECTVHLVLKGR